MRLRKKPADWFNRFIAWLIDIVIVSTVASVLLWPFWLFSAFILKWPVWLFGWSVGWGIWTLIFFLYWTILEGSSGQSVGKIAMHIRVVSEKGRKIDYEQAAVSALGKAFLLPFDVLIGILAFPGENQRLFNRVSRTKVIQE